MGIKPAALRDHLTIGTPPGDSRSNQKPQIGSQMLS